MTPAVVLLPPPYVKVWVQAGSCQKSIFFHVPEVGAVKLKMPLPERLNAPQGLLALLLAKGSSVLKKVTPFPLRLAIPTVVEATPTAGEA